MNLDPKVNTFVDGCGVRADAPIGHSTRVRFWLNESRQQDVSVYVEDGALHILGMYRPLLVSSVEDNHIEVRTEVWTYPDDKENDK